MATIRLFPGSFVPLFLVHFILLFSADFVFLVNFTEENQFKTISPFAFPFPCLRQSNFTLLPSLHKTMHIKAFFLNSFFAWLVSLIFVGLIGKEREKELTQKPYSLTTARLQSTAWKTDRGSGQIEFIYNFPYCFGLLNTRAVGSESGKPIV